MNPTFTNPNISPLLRVMLIDAADGYSKEVGHPLAREL